MRRKQDTRRTAGTESLRLENAVRPFDYHAVQLTDVERTAIARTMTSWRTVYPAIRALPDRSESLTKLTAMLAWELSNSGGSRKQLLTRIHTRINAMRLRMESRQISRHATQSTRRGALHPTEPARR